MPTVRSFASADVSAGRVPPPTPEQEAAILREIVLGLPDAVAYVDPDDTMRLANDAYMAVMGCERADIANLPTTEARLHWQFETGRQSLTHPTTEASVASALKRQVAGDGTPTIREFLGRIYEHRFIDLPEGRTMTVYHDITALKQQENELRETLAYAAAMNDVLKVISRSAFDLTTVLRTVVSKAAELCGAERGILYRYQDGACRFETGYNIPPGYEEIERGRPIHATNLTIVGRALLERRTVQIVDTLTDPDYVGKDQARAGNVRSLLGVPLLRDGEPVCVVALARSVVEAFTDRQIEMVTSFADQAVIAIENARLLEELQNARQEAERERALMRTILDNVTDGMALYEANGDIALWNNAMYEINSFPRDVFAQFRNVRESLRWQLENGSIPRQHSTLDEDVETCVRPFCAPNPIALTRHRPNGRWVDIRWSTLPDGRRLVTHHDVTDLKQRELELRQAHDATEQSRATMQIVLETMTDGVTLCEPDGTIIQSNDAAYAVNGIPRTLVEIGNIADRIGWLVQQADPGRTPEADDADLARHIALFRAGDPFHPAALRPNGRWVERRIQILRDGRKLVVHRDVTDLKQQEIQLQQARDATERARTLMETVLDNMTDGVILWDGDGDWLYANKAFYDIQQTSQDRLAKLRRFGAMMDALVERNPIDAAFRDAANERFQRADGEAKLRATHDGRWVEGAFHRTADGGTLGVFRDVTAMKVQEDRLAHERGVMQAILDNMTDGVALCEADGTMVLRNNAIYDMNAFPREEFAAYTNISQALVWQLERGLIPCSHGAIEAEVDALMEAFGAGPTHRPARLRLNGLWVEANSIVLPDGRRLLTHRDVTELKKREERIAEERDAAEQARSEAEAANQAKSTFLATMSHEIRTPMNGVLGMMDVLEHQSMSQDQKNTVAVMRDSATSLLRIIDDLLDFSKIEAGRMELEEAPFSLSDIVTGSVRSLRAQTMAKGIRLAAAIDPGSADALIGDSTRVRQILFNLLGNAVKFTEQGSIHVRAGTEPLGGGRQLVTLTVADTGIGMDAEQQSRLFQPFAQADSSTTRRFGGTGLGLSIVRRLAQLMGGDVAAESAPNQGSVFSVTLPLRAAPALVQSDDTVRPLEQLTAISGKLLVVDDHPINREVMVRQLELLGLSADTAEDGLAALELWRPGRYAAVLADIHMPRMDGYGLTDAIRQRERTGGTARTPIMAVTANAMRGEEERCLAAGMDAYIAKPVSLPRLRETLLRWVEVGQRELAISTPIKTGIDRERLKDWMGDDPDAIDSLLRRFVDSAQESAHSIDMSLQQKDLPAAATAAHKLKGASLAVGAIALAEISACIETCAKEGKHAVCAVAMDALGIEMRALRASV